MKFTDFLFFRRMLMPIIVQIFFWVAIAVCILVGGLGLFNHQVLSGLGLIIVGPLLVRLACEYIIVFFRVSDTLTEIKEALVVQRKGE